MKIARRKTTKGKNILVLKREKAARPVCGKCGNILYGLKKAYMSEIAKLPKSQKTVNRPFGGTYCSSCVQEIFKTKARLV